MHKMSSRDLAVERRILARGLEVGKSRLKAIDDQLLVQVRSGDSSSGLTTQVRDGKRVWALPPAQVVSIVKQFGVDAEKPGVLTPAQTLQEASPENRPLLKALWPSITKTKPGSTQLVPIEDSISAKAFITKT